jgi:hypothetical protein
MAAQARATAVACDMSLSGARSRRPGEASQMNERRRGHDNVGFEPQGGFESTLIQHADLLSEPVFMSAKLRGVSELVTEWFSVAPDDKIISGSPPGCLSCNADRRSSLCTVRPIRETPRSSNPRHAGHRLRLLLWRDDAEGKG